MNKKTAPGALVIIGGAEDKLGKSPILLKFVQLAGGSKSRLVVLTVASKEPQEVGAGYLEAFTRLGAKSIEIVGVKSRDDANAAAKQVERATGVFFTGGDQRRIITLLGGTTFDIALRNRHLAGAVLGGTSAGASAMSGTMIVGGDALVSPRAKAVSVGPGLDFVPGVIIDQHFAQRGRIGRLLSAVARYPHHLGVGIDEDTAMIVVGEKFEVIGSGSVTVVDAGSVTFDGDLEPGAAGPLALFGVLVHVLPSGFRFDLHERKPLGPELKNKVETEVKTSTKGGSHDHRNGASPARAERTSRQASAAGADRTRAAERTRKR